MPTPEFLARTPLPADVQAQIIQLNTELRDPLPGLDSTAKKAQLARMSYTDFVNRVWGFDPRVLGISSRHSVSLPRAAFTAAGRTALCEKVPLVYTNVFVRQWTALQALQVSSGLSPGMWPHRETSTFPSVSVTSHTQSHQKSMLCCT